MVNTCAVCTSNSNISCMNCNQINYCSKDCQKNDFEQHKINCKPFKIRTNKIYGRYLVASKDIKQGELILKESPIIVGPSITSIPLCLKCFTPISPLKKPIFCEKCGSAPVCSINCQGKSHSDAECTEFKTNLFISPSKLIQYYQCVTPLRCLLLRKTNPELWTEFTRMESHVEARRNTPIWRNYKLNVEAALQQFNMLAHEDVEGELVQKICGVLDVNSFEMRVPGIEIDWQAGNLVECVRGVFVQAALMAHDCIGNTHLAVDDQFNMFVHASVPIKKDTPIFFNYTNALQGTSERQEHLKEGKYFNCNCKRCKDPTECKTYISSIICVKCRRGYVVPIKSPANTFSHATFWRCSDKKCPFQCRGSLIKSTITCAQQLIEKTDKYNLLSVESLLQKLSFTFCPYHSLILDLKQCLVGLYSQNSNQKYLIKKLQICKEIIPIIEIIEPGISRLIGISLYEMHVPMVIIANKQFDNGDINADELLKTLRQAEEALKKSISYLIYEPTNSPEGRLAARAITELKMLRKNTLNVEKIVTKSNKNKK